MTKHYYDLQASQDPSFETVRNDVHEDVLLLYWQAALNNESKLFSGEVPAAANEKTLVEQMSSQIENLSTNEEDVIGQKDKSAVIELGVS